MAIDPVAEMVDRLHRCGFQPHEVGHEMWESRCPGRSSVDHTMRLWRGGDGNLVMQCQSTDECSFTEDFQRVARCHRDPATRPAVIVESPAAAIQRSLSKCHEPNVSDHVDLNLPAAGALPETAALPRSDAVVEGQGTLPTAHGPDPGSSSPEVAAAEATEDPARGDDSDESAPVTSGDTERTRAPEKLLRIAAGARPFRRPDGRYSVSIAVDGHQECHDLESPEVIRWLTRRYYESAGRLPSSASLAATIRALAAQADIARSCGADFVRVGSDESGSSIVVDLGDSAWRAVEIQATGWQVVDRPDVHFRRAAGQRALPVPARDGSLEPLLKYVNVERADLPLLIGWLTAALRPTGPHPILVITGEQGSAKSTLARICRLLIDPHNAPLRAEPKDHRDLMVAALHGWVQAYDNLSAMPDWLSNGLCRLVTGGGISTRGLFTNHDEVVWSAHRPIILTSIDDIVQRPDVIDRSIFLQLRSIAPSSRRLEQDLWAQFMPDYPGILGGLLDAVVAGMRLWSEVRLAELERMADFTHWGEAVAQGIGWPPGTFVTAYRANRQAANSVSLEESLMAQALLELAKYHGPWKGTLTQFLELIGEWTGYAAVTTPGWPKSPSRAAIELRRIAPQLRTFGVCVTFDRSSRAGRIVTFTPTRSGGSARTHVG
jgi:hypothetical protein